MVSLNHKPEIRDHIREAFIVQSRLVMVSFLALILSFILIARLVYLQIDQYDKFKKLAEDNSISTRPIAPVRGLIFDRNGKPLASNERAYNLEILPSKVKEMDVLINSIGEVIELSEGDISQFKKLIGHRPKFESQVLRANLSEYEAAKYSANQHRLPGSFLVAALQRNYPEGALTGHVLGYVGRINDAEVKKIDKVAYGGTHYIGKRGIEAEYESILLGKVGSEDIETTAYGRPVRTLSRDMPKTGKTLFLSLDIELQRKAASLLEDVEGAVVALDPKTGEVLALVSAPGYDANPYVNGISRKAYAALRESERRPLINRAIYGRYAPGSTIKGFMGLIGMQNGISSSESIFAPGYYKLPNSKHKYRCWKKSGHGRVNLNEAIAQSCDVYFYQLAKRVGIDRLHEGMTAFGFGHKTGIDIPNEDAALMPSRAWKKRSKGRPWYPGETVITGIGQGYMLATPVQLAASMALLANRGQPVVPHLVTAIQDSDNGELEQVQYSLPDRVADIPDTSYEEVIQAMRNVMHGPRGTARRVGKGLPYEIAGKTGTAQVKSIPQEQKYDKENTPKKYRDHSLFVAFAPVNDPRIALAVIVEHGGSGSKVAAPIAGKIIDYYLVDRLGLYPRQPIDDIAEDQS